MKKLKLLIVDDDADQRELIRDTLLDHFGPAAGSAHDSSSQSQSSGRPARGAEVVCVASRCEALSHDLGSFDLILTDYNLPDGTGMELLEEIKERCATPVVMVTGENVGHTAAEAIRRGATDYVVKLGDYLETIPLVVEKDLTAVKVQREKEALQRRLKAKNQELEKALARLKELAATDPLTGLYNRRHFSRVLDQMFAEAHRCGHDLSCVMMDLDGYKQLNDEYGHQMGDRLLVLAGKVILANMRRMDVAARYGGDEFVLLLPHAAESEAARIVERIREQYRQASDAELARAGGARGSGVAMSVGVASIGADQPSGGDALVTQADHALYQAKAAGRNRVCAGGPRGPRGRMAAAG